MTPRQIVASHIRQFRPIPRGSIIWLHVDSHDDLIGINEIGWSIPTWLKKVDNPQNVTLWLDTPDGDFEDSFIIPASKIVEPVAGISIVPANTEARERYVSLHGETAIKTAENLVFHYTEYLLNGFRQDYGYKGPAPKIKVNWNALHSWGGRKGITISPAYLYNYAGKYSFSTRYYEYRHIAKSEEIGEFYSISRLTHIKALCAHELAHFIQRWSNRTYYEAGKYELPELDYSVAHGEGWQELYAYFRKHLNERNR